MTASELTRRAIVLLAAGSPSSVWYDMEAEVSALIPLAMSGLAETIANDAGRAGLLMQDYSVAVSNGVANLLTATGSVTAAADILWHTVGRGVVKNADGLRFVYIPDLYAFQGEQLPGYRYFTLQNPNILVRDSGPYSLSLSETVTVTANFVPTVATLPTGGQLDDDAVEILAGIARAQLPAAKAA